MNIEYEEFASIEDVFLYMSAASPPMKNTMPISSYKGHVMSFIPIGQGRTNTYLMIYTKGEMEPGIYEFDVQGMSYKKVDSVERADKNYFILLTPRRNTIADAALAQLEG